MGGGVLAAGFSATRKHLLLMLINETVNFNICAAVSEFFLIRRLDYTLFEALTIHGTFGECLATEAQLIGYFRTQ
jgi:hypothetical protein